MRWRGPRNETSRAAVLGLGPAWAVKRLAVRTMSTSSRNERSLLSHEENEIVQGTHHPAIYDFDAAGLQALRVRLRQLRGKERTLARAKERERRGKTAARGGSFPGVAELPQRRKQIFAAALKRVNKEARRLAKLEARALHVDAARRALAMRRAAQAGPSYPAAAHTANEGMQPRESTRRPLTTPRDRIGSVSQRTRVAQAVRDARVP